MESFKRPRVLADIQENLSPKSKTLQLELTNQISSPNKKARRNLTKSPQKHDMKKNVSLENNDDDNIENWLNDNKHFYFDHEIFNTENSSSNSQNANLKESNKSKSVNLNGWNRCVVQEIERDVKNFDLILSLKEENSDNFGICRLQGPWCNIKINTKDLISITAIWNSDFNCFVVSANGGLIVTNPDYLVSGTSVVGSLFCTRRGVLQEKFRGLDSENKAMVIGSVIHKLLQLVLIKKLSTFEQIKNLVEELLKCEEMVFTLYSSKMSLEEVKCEVTKFIPNIVTFIHQYVEQKGSIQLPNENFQGVIDKIQDIEENLWIPQLGLKGKVDISVIARQKKTSSKLDEKYMPLELKTGKSSFSVEHKGQLILYQMMLSEIGKKVDTGLLLYLRDGVMKEISSTRNEQRDLIMLRNELAYYLTRQMKLKDNIVENNSAFEELELPEPINHRNACSKCPYQTICSTFLKSNENFKFSENNPLEEISKECTSHLTVDDFRYFIHWCGLLSLEDQEIKKSSFNVKSLWVESPEERYHQGRALINLKICGEIKFIEHMYIHTFKMDYGSIERPQGEEMLDFTISGINVGDYVIISSSKRIAIASGNVYDLTRTSIALSLERNLSQNYAQERFIIDKHESQSLNLFNYTNLGVLLDNIESINHLRRLIIAKVTPTFTSVIPKIIATEGIKILTDLNSVQRKAVMQAMTTNDYLLIKGLPGTGKTQTLVAIVRSLYLMRKSILITSHTHSAVDNILIRLKKFDIPFLRLGSNARVSREIYENSEAHLTKTCKTPKELDIVYTAFNIFGVTCLGSSHPAIIHRKFDMCIVDEATQVFQPTVLRPLFYAKKFILVGDPQQLPPVIRSREAKYLGAEETLFHRLDSTESTAVLTLQYRMNKIITKLANDLTYHGKLVCANETIMKSNMNIPNKNKFLKCFLNQKWILRALETHIDQSVILIDTQNCLSRHLYFLENNKKADNLLNMQLIEQRFEEKENNDVPRSNKLNYINYCEAAVIFHLIKVLLQCECKAENIGIIASYRAQVELLRKLKENYQNYYKNELNIDFSNVEVNTVDQYQGRDKEIIFYSCTRTGDSAEQTTERKKEAEILEDRRRLTVAITRSKHKLIIVGDVNNLSKYTPLNDLFSKVPSRCKLMLEDEKFGFSWKNILEELLMVMKKN